MVGKEKMFYWNGWSRVGINKVSSLYDKRSGKYYCNR